MFHKFKNPKIPFRKGGTIYGSRLDNIPLNPPSKGDFCLPDFMEQYGPTQNIHRALTIL